MRDVNPGIHRRREERTLQARKICPRQPFRRTTVRRPPANALERERFHFCSRKPWRRHRAPVHNDLNMQRVCTCSHV